MKVYIEVVMIINFIFDACILLSVDLILKRHVRLKRVILGALVGEASMFTMIPILKRFTFLIKMVLTIAMCITTFSYKDIKYTLNNSLYLYFTGIILGGFITFLYNEFRVNLEYSFRYILILSCAPIILYIYYKMCESIKNDYNNRHSVVFTYSNERYSGVGYLDSGNNLTSPISGKPIILVEREYIKYKKLKLLPVVYHALNHTGIVECFKPDIVYIDGKIKDNLLIGLSDVKFNIEGCDVLLNARMDL